MNRKQFIRVTEPVSPQSPPSNKPRTLVAVLAHADDEGPIAPILSRYAREGVRVHMIIASDGAAGSGSAGAYLNRPDSVPTGDALTRIRGEEARCAAEALGIEPPILLEFPDGKLGDYLDDRTLLYRLTERIAAELARLAPDAIVTWGPDGGTGHPDHRIISTIVTQLARAGVPGVPERLFYMTLPVEVMRTINPQRGEPPMLVPDDKYFTVCIEFAPQDFDAAYRAMACHRTQFTPDVVERVMPAIGQAWSGVIRLIPAFATAGGKDLFR
jgi:LmbE family N-acetylglucosaminyl deacetylase